MQFKHAPVAVSAVFDDPNLVSVAGLVPMLRLARSAGLDELAQSRLSVPTDKGANAGGKVMALVAGMLAGADSIDDMNLLRHGGMGRLFDRTYAPSTLGSLLREFRFGHVRQLDAVASRTLVNLASAAPLLQIRDGERVMVDVDDTIIEVHGYQKQGASFGYSGVRGLNALVATALTTTSAPVILAQRLRQGKTGSPKARPGSSPTPSPRFAAWTWAAVFGRCCGRTPRSTATPPSAPRSRPARTCPSPFGWTPR